MLLQITTRISKIRTIILFWFRQILESKKIMEFSFKVYLLSKYLWNAPDYAEVIIFNELPYSCPGVHSCETVCKKRFCETCRLQAVIKYLDAAQCSLDIAHLTFSSQQMHEALLRAKNRGVMIRMITDCEMIFVRGSVYFELFDKGIPIRIARKGMMMHHKFCIIDGDTRIMQLNRTEGWKYKIWNRQHRVMTGSLNWTRQGIYGNFENVVITSNNVVMALYQQVFEEMWLKFEDIATKKKPLFLNKWH